MSVLVRRATTCYMTDRSERGPAYAFWLRVKTEQTTRGWTDSELYRRSGVSRRTIRELETRTRTEAGTVNALADALDIPRDEAHRLAGLLPADEQIAATDAPAESSPQVVSAREAILRDPIYSDQQRRAMLELLDIFEQANRSRQE